MWRVMIIVGCFLAACGDDADAAGNGSTTGDTTTEPSAMQGMTAAHNAVRKSASSKISDLTWSNTIASMAQSYAEKCVFEHSGAANYGENLYASYGSSDTPAAVVNSWASESTDYDYATNTCASGKVCGHYTQVVWAATTQLGCGTATCTSNSPFGNGEAWVVWVCNYAPPGNVVGERPY